MQMRPWWPGTLLTEPISQFTELWKRSLLSGFEDAAVEEDVVEMTDSADISSSNVAQVTEPNLSIQEVVETISVL